MPLNENDQAASLRKRSDPHPLVNSKKAVCCIAVASGKGGVGKTFITVNLAIAFAQLTKKVLLVDADLGLANADILFGIHPEFSLQDAIFRGKRLEEVIIHTEYGVDLLAASSGSKEMVSMGRARMELFIKDLISFASEYDVLLFDCAAGIDSNVTSFIALAPHTMIVATPQPTSILDAYALIKLIYQDSLTENPGIIVNMAEDDNQGKKVIGMLNHVTNKFLSKSVELTGIIPETPNVAKALKNRKPLLTLYEDDPATVKFREIASLMLHKQQGMTNVSKLDGNKLIEGLLKT